MGRCAYLAHRASVPATSIVPDNIVGDDADSGNTDSSHSNQTQDQNQFNSDTDNSGGSASGNFDVSKNNTGTNGGSSAAGKDKDHSGQKHDGSSDNSGDHSGSSGGKTDQDGGSSGTEDPGNNPGGTGTDEPGKDDTGTDDPGKTDPGKDDTGSGGGSGGTSAPVLQFYKGNTEWNQKFQAENLFPGDHVKKYYCIEIYHSRPTTVYFKAKITSDKAEKYLAMNPLQDNLKLKVTRISQIPSDGSQTTGQSGSGGQEAVQPVTEDVLCDAAFSKVNDQEYAATFQVASDSPTIGYYCIEAYLDTSVGNDCMNKTLTADFQWYVKDGGSSGGGSSGTVKPGKPDQPEQPDNPETPDNPEKPSKPDKPAKPAKPSDNDNNGSKPSKPAGDNNNHNGSDNAGDNSDGTGSLIRPPKTGDVLDLTLWTAVGGSALLLLILIAKKRKEDKAENGSNS